MSAAKFIAFEGGEGTGKTTQSRLLARRLEAEGIALVHTREPGGTPGAEAIRDLLLQPPGEGWGAEAEAMLFAAARSDHVAKTIRPALVQGQWVICDRFLDSSRAYQGGAGRLGDAAIRQLHQLGSAGLQPDLTIVIDVDEARIGDRLKLRDGESGDAIGSRDAAYHRAVNAAFLDLAQAEPERFAVIDGRGSVDEVAGRIWSAVASLLDASR